MKESDLVLEVKDKDRAEDNNFVSSSGMEVFVTPVLGDDYWVFRVKVGKDQAIIGFPKFTTIGIGFEKEEDWNTNLPYTCETDIIFEHIEENKDDDNISDKLCMKAIRMIQKVAANYLK